MGNLLFVGIFLLLIPAAMLVVLHYLDNVEDLEKRELQRLIGECLDSK